MTMIANYPSKKACKESVGEKLRYTETSIFGPEYPENGTGTITVCNRPHITGIGREWFGRVTIKDHIIQSVK